MLEVQCDVGVECLVCLDELEHDGKIAEELRVVEEEGWKNRLELIRMEVDVLHVGEEGEVCFRRQCVQIVGPCHPGYLGVGTLVQVSPQVLFPVGEDKVLFVEDGVQLVSFSRTFRQQVFRQPVVGQRVDGVGLSLVPDALPAASGYLLPGTPRGGQLETQGQQHDPMVFRGVVPPESDDVQLRACVVLHKPIESLLQGTLGQGIFPGNGVPAGKRVDQVLDLRDTHLIECIGVCREEIGRQQRDPCMCQLRIVTVLVAFRPVAQSGQVDGIPLQVEVILCPVGDGACACIQPCGILTLFLSVDFRKERIVADGRLVGRGIDDSLDEFLLEADGIAVLLEEACQELPVVEWIDDDFLSFVGDFFRCISCGTQFPEDVLHQVAVAVAQVSVQDLVLRQSRIVEADEYVAHGDTQSVTLLFRYLINLVVEEVEEVGEVELFVFVDKGAGLQRLEEAVDVVGLDDGLCMKGDEGKEVGLLVLLLQIQLGIEEHTCHDTTKDEDKRKGDS